MRNQTRIWVVLGIMSSLLALALACSGKKETGPAENQETAPTAKTFTPSGNEGTITGSAAFTGTPPAPKKIDTSADAACTAKSPNLTTEDIVVKDGKLANVFVYVKEGTTATGEKIADLAFATPAEAGVLDQNGCHYRPHVLGLQTNQKIKITNSDPTQHNVHPTPKNNPEWNQTQANGAAPIERSFTRAEVLIPVKCNQHPWMKAYIGVLKHPFFAITAEDGSFTIKGVPPGQYTVAAWHEKGGPSGTEKTMQVTVPAKGSAKADFSFGEAATASTSGSLEMMPALDLPMVGRR